MEPTITENTFNLGKINAIKSLLADRDELQSQIDELSAPMLADFTLIPELYDVFCKTFESLKNKHRTYHRKKFLFVMLYCYCPAALVGGRMLTGLRKAIANVFGLSSYTPISDNCAGIMMLCNYADFRKHINIYYDAVLEHLASINHPICNN